MTDMAVMEDTEDLGSAPRIEGGEEIVVPAPGPVTIYVRTVESGTHDTVGLLCVGWNQTGSPIVVGDDGGLRMLDATEIVADIDW